MLPRASLAVLLLLAACGRAPEPPPAKPVAAACASRPEGSRWAGDYRETARFGDTDEEALGGWGLGGIVATDSVIYVLETQKSSLWLLRPGLSVIRRIGREGDGPGEWRPSSRESHGGSMRWVSASGDRVRIFDAQRIQEFDANGRFRRVVVNGTQAARLSFMQSRFVYRGDTLFYASDGYDVLGAIIRDGGIRGPIQREVVDGRNPFRVRMRVDGKDYLLLQIGLVPVTGKWGIGPAHAIPLWDTNGGCVVASDGAEPVLFYAAVGGRQDTVPVPVPDRVERAADYVEQLGGLLPPEVARQEPKAPRRILDLVLDPDGFVWLLPVQPKERIEGGVEVLRVPLGGGEAVLDTVPAFPRAFGSAGVYYSGARGLDDELMVKRYDRVPNVGG